jgi:hypothetical protein
MLKKKGEHWVQYPEMLSSEEYTNYIKDPFTRDKKMTYLNVTLPRFKVQGTEGDCSLPPYNITYES